mmetsp:Transcript_13709/g.17882  ORF Transcript_13709/g.17882 Transcript_13709/m.17882 type:complete len:211 (+) Transcript_13709:167-799(+)
MCGLLPAAALTAPVPSHGCIPIKSITAVTASSIFLNCKANFSKTSPALPTVSQDLRKSGTETLAMKSAVAISKSSKGYSSSKPGPSSSPDAGSTCTTVNRSSQVKVLGDNGASSLRSKIVKQFMVSPYFTCSQAISPDALKVSDSLSSTNTVTLSKRWSSIVFWTLNCKTTCFWKMCFVHVTKYSVSLSVSGTGKDDRKARPNEANSGIA